MNNNLYETNYSKYIEPIYGKKRNKEEDSILFQESVNEYNNDNLEYNLLERDFIKYEIYTIDPEGCKDADDAFSIYEENNKLYLAIHIADPTEFINLDSELWTSIERNVITKYPSNRKPIHLIPDLIMQISSLMENEYGDIKNAITKTIL